MDDVASLGLVMFMVMVTPTDMDKFNVEDIRKAEWDILTELVIRMEMGTVITDMAAVIAAVKAAVKAAIKAAVMAAVTAAVARMDSMDIIDIMLRIPLPFQTMKTPI